VLGRTSSSTLGLGSSGSCDEFNTLRYKDDIDIQFQVEANLPGGLTWNFGPSATTTSQFDFESTALHELGHAIGLGHVIDATKVMHFSSSNGSDIRSISAEEIAGGEFIVSYSSNTNCITSPAAMTALSSGTCALPIELTYFEAKPHNQQVLLTWETATEVNNNFFTLEHSFDAKNFEAFAEIGGAGFSSEPLNYSHFHTKPVDDHNYYRLKQTDFDGSFTYSQVESVNFENTKTQKLSIYPNPVTIDELSFQYHATNSGQIQVNIFNLAGKSIISRQESITTGRNYLNYSLQELPKGMYLLNTQNEKGVVLTKRFVKI
jgi:hypothetical protein